MKRNKARYAKLVKAVRDRDLVCRVCSRWVGEYGHTHHIVYRSLGGKDEMSNLILLCDHHHRLEHEKYIRITGTADALQVEHIR